MGGVGDGEGRDEEEGDDGDGDDGQCMHKANRSTTLQVHTFPRSSAACLVSLVSWVSSDWHAPGILGTQAGALCCPLNLWTSNSCHRRLSRLQLIWPSIRRPRRAKPNVPMARPSGCPPTAGRGAESDLARRTRRVLAPLISRTDRADKHQATAQLRRKYDEEARPSHPSVLCAAWPHAPSALGRSRFACQTRSAAGPLYFPDLCCRLHAAHHPRDKNVRELYKARQ